MKEMINNLGNRMVALMRVINISKREWADDERRFTECRESNKFDHELNGMTMALKAMDIDFDFEYDSEVVEFTAVVIMGIRFDI